MRITNTSPLVINNLSLVHRCIRGIKIPKLLEYEDLFQAGCEGLVQASKRFDAKKGFCFSTYAYKYIKGYILRAIRKNSSLVHIPVYKLLQYSNGDTDSQVKVSYINGILWDTVEVSKHITIDDTNKMERTIDYYLLRRLINRYKHKLTPKQKNALEIYYNITNDNEGNTLKMVADKLDVSTERARQLINRAIANLRKAMNNDGV